MQQYRRTELTLNDIYVNPLLEINIAHIDLENHLSKFCIGMSKIAHRDNSILTNCIGYCIIGIFRLYFLTGFIMSEF